MVTSILLINADKKKINAISDKLAGMDGISEVYSVSGRYDIIAVIRVNTNDQLAELVTDKLVEVEGIIKTETSLAFRVVSKHDLESFFSIGS